MLTSSPNYSNCMVDCLAGLICDPFRGVLVHQFGRSVSRIDMQLGVVVRSSGCFWTVWLNRRYNVTSVTLTWSSVPDNRSLQTRWAEKHLRTRGTSDPKARASRAAGDGRVFVRFLQPSSLWRWIISGRSQIPVANSNSLRLRSHCSPTSSVLSVLKFYYYYYYYFDVKLFFCNISLIKWLHGLLVIWFLPSLSILCAKKWNSLCRVFQQRWQMDKWHDEPNEEDVEKQQQPSRFRLR